MADRMYAEIWIGGQVTPSQHKRLLECVKKECDDSEHDGHTGTFRAWADETSWGEFPGLEKLCREMGLSYKRRSEAKHEWDRCIEFWLPGFDEPEYRAINGDGKVLLTTDSVRKLCQDHPTDTQPILNWLAELDLPTIPALVVHYRGRHRDHP